ncbi:MAG: alanyl-tRNA editing protein [Candidatus Micrarchaeaceae archaeon]
MTEKLYWKDQYMREFESKVTKAVGNRIYLESTAFYPTGGGQPADTGKLFINGKEYKINDVESEGDEIVHISDAVFDVQAGASAKGMIDWDKRYMHMRLHTAIHLLDAIVERFYGSGMITGGQIFDDRARIDVDMPELNKEKAAEIITKANAEAAKGYRVSAREIDKDEALKMERLARTEPGRELIKSLDKVRVVEIEGLDMQADGGTHVRNTNEIGTMLLSNYENKGRHSKRIEIRLQNQ